MSTITLGGKPHQTKGDLPAPGTQAPDFTFISKNLKEQTLYGDLADKVKVIIAVPSIDTGVCQAETRKFNEELGKIGGDVVGLVVSRDLPFATNRFCEGEGIENVITGSDFLTGEFVGKYNTEIVDGPFKGLSARAVFVVGKDNEIKHTELVTEVGDQPDYEGVLGAVNALL